MLQKKMYVLDTNVLVYDPMSLYEFPHEGVGLPFVVIEELDQLKTEGSVRGANAREVVRYLDLLRERGNLQEGVRLDNGGFLSILFPVEGACLPYSIPLNTVDNHILLIALGLQSEGADVALVTKDLNLRVKADVLGLNAIDYTKDAVVEDELYKGWQEILVSAHELKLITHETVSNFLDGYTLTINEFVVIKSQHMSHNYKVFRYCGRNRFKEVLPPSLSFTLEPKNQEQLMALNLLFDPEIPLVMLIGSAGTGKTFLTLLAALEQVVFHDDYEKILISRPVVPLGPDIGYLPGDIREKLLSWMQPVYDNMGLILHAIDSGKNKNRGVGSYKGFEDRKRAKKMMRQEQALSLDNLIDSGKISLEAITYMRGRSIPYQFILIDEVQNLTPHEVKTLVSRVGQGSKIILAGDPYQIDSPYLDFSTNGLMVACNKLKGQELFGVVYLETSERSPLSKLASEML